MGTPITALFGRGANGLPPAEPLDLASLVLPPSPNTCLAAPPGAPGPVPHRVLPPFAATPAALWAAVQQAAGAQPRTTLLAAWPEHLQAQWVERSAIMNYPDIIVALLLPDGDRTGLVLYSRSLFGWSDLGVNAKRVDRWIAAIESALPRG
ncbi:DUF1499 domain-containing protein [Humitalea sp. 24SJ18S-53]|uniref:DUF1499 domain-containing protein n=1 Tax=Humitalea sp. 24SJ18S-53 TaxID=3422307 RepID=UPI003D674575